jgi:carboxypeptidase family protein
MTTSPEAAHQPSVELLQPLPAEAAAGAALVAKVRVSCPHGCDLHGGRLEVIAPDRTRTEASLAGNQQGASAEFALTAPGRIGNATWRIVSPSQEIAGATHAETSVDISTDVRPHATSLATWGFASPAIMGEIVRVTIGAKCAAGCRLAGEPIAILDESGTPLAEGTLGDTPWPGTEGLYWTEVELPVPAREGVVSLSVRFAAAHNELPHADALGRFSLVVARAPEHRVTVRVREKETAAPITEADIRLHAFQARTDAEGLATIGVPSGTYEVYVWKAGYETEPVTIDVTGDVAVEVAALTLSEDDPDAHWN